MGVSNKVTVELTVAEHKAITNLLAVDNALKKMGGSLDKMGQKGAGSGKQLQQGFAAVHGSVNRAVKAFLSLNMGMRAFHNMIALVRSELDKYQQMRASSADQEVEFGRRMRQIEAILPAGRLSDMTTDQIAAYIEKNRGTVRKDVAAKSVMTAISGGAEMPVSERVRSGIAIAKVLEPFEASAQESAGRMAQMMREAYPNLKPEEAAATFLQTLGVSSITDPNKVAQNLIAPALQMKGMGFDLENSLELLTAGQIATKDIHGRMSRTAILGNLQRVQELYGEKYNLQGMDIFDFMTGRGKFAGSEISKTVNQRLMGGMIDDEVGRVAAQLQNDPDYIGEAGDILSRAAVRPGMKSFFALAPESGGAALTDPSQYAAATRQAVEKSIQVGAESYETMMSRRGTNLSTLAYDVERLTDSLKTRFHSDMPTAIGGVIDKFLVNLTAELGRSGGSIADPIAKYRELLASGEGEVAALNRLMKILASAETEARTVYRAATGPRLGMGVGGGGPLPLEPHIRRDEDLKGRDQQNVQALETAQAALQELINEVKHLREATERRQATPQPVEVVNEPTPTEPSDAPLDWVGTGRAAVGVSGGAH